MARRSPETLHHHHSDRIEPSVAHPSVAGSDRPRRFTRQRTGGQNGYTHTVAPTYDSFEDAYFYDLRRATNCYSIIRSVATPYTPRPINKIDLDMIRFRKAVERTLSPITGQTSTAHYPNLPANA